MKKLALLTLAMVLSTPVISQVVAQEQSTPDIAPNLPIVPAGEDAPGLNKPMNEHQPDFMSQTSINEVASQPWAALEDTTRYLLIMGTADGFSAAGAGAPCFSGKNNSTLNTSLEAAGFGDKDPATLTAALAKLSGDANDCKVVPKRGYDIGLIKSMPDDHLAIYLTGAVRGFAHLKKCEVQNHAYAAATATAAIFTAQTGAEPSQVLGEAFLEGCNGNRE